MRRRLLAVCRGHAATAGLFRRKANPPSSTSSSQASYRLRRVFFKTRHALILLLLAFTVQTLRWFARRWMRGCHFFIKTSSARFLAPPDPNRTRCAGLRFGGLRRVFFKTRRALILLLLAFTAQTLRWFARRWMRGCRFFIKTLSARFLAPPDPNRTRCAGLRFGGLR